MSLLLLNLGGSLASWCLEVRSQYLVLLFPAVFGEAGEGGARAGSAVRPRPLLLLHVHGIAAWICLKGCGLVTRA